MSASEAAIQAATISVWGAVTVGILATIGTIASALVGPFLFRRSEARAASERERIAALREIIPPMVDAAVRGQFIKGERERSVASVLASTTRLEMWLSKDEWPIGRIALTAFAANTDAKNHALVTAAYLLPAWARGEITAVEAKERFEQVTGLKIKTAWGADDPTPDAGL